MKVHCIQHVEFETPAFLESVISRQGHKLQITRIYQKEQLPDPVNFDILLIMGGPMGANDDSVYPWLSIEKQYIKKCIDIHKKIVGICLGAQLLANVLGAEVKKNKENEIGFFPVYLHKGLKLPLLDGIPDSFKPLHWHGDTFEIPAEANAIAFSAACTNQGFVYNDSIVGLQFHLEVTSGSLDELISHCKSDLVNGTWIQNAEKIKEMYLETEKANQTLMEKLYLNLCNT